MRHILTLTVVLALGLPGMAQTAPLSAREADEIAQAAVARLIELNNALVEEYFHAGQFDQAVVVIGRNIALGATQYENYADAAWLLWSSGKTDEAIQMYERMIEANPTDARAHFELGIFYHQHKNYAEAEKWLAKSLDLGLTGPYRHLYGHVLMKLGRNDEALAFWRKTLAEDPTDAVARAKIAELTQPAPAPAPAP